MQSCTAIRVSCLRAGSAITILTPAEYLGAVMDLAQSRRGEMVKMDYMSTDRVEGVIIRATQSAGTSCWPRQLPWRSIR